MKRRDLMKMGGAGALGLSASAVQAHNSGEVFNWKMIMPWPKKFPGLGSSAEWFAEEVRKVTNGRLNITIYGAGELVPAFEVLTAVSDGVAELGHGSPYYWKGKVPEAEIFTAVPFGMTPLETTSWFFNGGGEELLNELYEPFGVKSVLSGNTDYQMGGWFNKEINSLADLQGLKIRMPGIGGEVLKRAGASPVNMPGGEIFTSVQSGVIDAADWVGPWNDQAFGLYKAAKYYYGGWQEPGSTVETLINKEALESLPEDLKEQLIMVAHATCQKMLCDFKANNAKSLQTLIEKENVEVRYFPEDVIAELQKHTKAYLDEYGERSELAGRILKSYRDYQALQEKLAENEFQFLKYRYMNSQS